MTMRQTPLLTIVLMSYNQRDFIVDALRSVLAQTYRNLEIIVSDDCSADGSFDVVEEYLSREGMPHHVILNRNPSNLGLVAHVNKILGMARGELVVIAAGDDISRPDRVERLFEAYKTAQPAPWLVHSSVNVIGPTSLVWKPPVLQSPGLLDICQSSAIYIGATVALSKDLWRSFGPLTVEGVYEDLVLGFRAALTGRIAYVDAPLVDYRMGSGLSTRDTDRNIRTQFAEHRRKIFLMQAVYRQRLLDLQHFTAREAFGSDHRQDTLHACQTWLTTTLESIGETAAYHAAPARYIWSAVTERSLRRALVPLRDTIGFLRARRQLSRRRALALVRSGTAVLRTRP